MVKDEADIVAATRRADAGQVDHVLVADNGSTDGTAAILDASSRVRASSPTPRPVTASARR